MTCTRDAQSPVRWRHSLAWSALFAAALMLLYLVVVMTPYGQDRLDARGIGILPPVPRVFTAMRVGMPVLAGVAAAVVTVAALLHRRWADVVACGLSAGTAILLCGLLRDDFFARPQRGTTEVINSFPSRHVVITCALCVTVMRLWPWLSGRRAAGVGAMAVVGIASLGALATYAHRASDSLGAVLLVGVFAAGFARAHVPSMRMLRWPWPIWGVLLVVVSALAWVVAAATTGPVAFAGFAALTVAAPAGLTGLVSCVAAGGEFTG